LRLKKKRYSQYGEKKHQQNYKKYSEKAFHTGRFLVWLKVRKNRELRDKREGGRVRLSMRVKQGWRSIIKLLLRTLGSYAYSF
jgi:hypothetical protein